MLKTKELFRLKFETRLSARKIAKALNTSHTVINQYLRRFEQSDLSYEELMTRSDKEIVAILFDLKAKPSKYALPDWSSVYQEMRHKHVTLELLHEEYAASP